MRGKKFADLNKLSQFYTDFEKLQIVDKLKVFVKNWISVAYMLFNLEVSKFFEFYRCLIKFTIT